MTPNEYQRAAMRTAPQTLNLGEAALGMATEASEAADVLKKHLYQGHPLDVEKLKKEMGDALWYMAYVCHMVEGLELEGIMEDNIKKLSVRFPGGFTTEASMARADVISEERHCDKERANPLKGEVWRHFKGNLYRIIGIAHHTETGEKYVIHQRAEGTPGLWAIPLEMFMSRPDQGKYPNATQKYRFERTKLW